MYNAVCANGAALFNLSAGEAFVCDVDRHKYRRLQQQLSAQEPEWGSSHGRRMPCEGFCSEWTCEHKLCQGCRNKKCAAKLKKAKGA